MTEIARRSAVNDDYCTQALQAALELSMVNIGGNSAGSSRSNMDVLNVPELPESKSQNVTECVAVPSSEHVAEIVGRQGCKIKALRAKTNTYIKTPVRGEEPVFSISGRPEHVSSARREILELVEHLSKLKASRKGSQDEVTTIHVKVPYSVVGLVVGPKGATVKRIQHVTQTYIVTPSRDKEPYFEVKGAPANVERAKKEIERYIASRTNFESLDFNEEPNALEFKVPAMQNGYVEENLSFQKSLCRDPQSADIPNLLSSPVFQFPGVDDVPPQHGLSSMHESFPVAQSSSKLSSVFQFPSAAPSLLGNNGGTITSDGSVDAVGMGGLLETPKFPSKPAFKSPTMYSGMRFTPPSSSYQPMLLSLQASEAALGHGSIKSGTQPISPTGSYESSCSDGIASVSPNLSPHSCCLYTQTSASTTPVTCYFCNADEDMAVLIPCKHSNFCQLCAQYVAYAHGKCPLCYTQVTKVMHL